MTFNTDGHQLHYIKNDIGSKIIYYKKEKKEKEE